MSTAEFLGFEVLKEPWNLYTLSNGTILKLKYILQKIRLEKAKNGKTSASIAEKTLAVSEAPESLYGPPGRKYSEEEVRAKIIEKNLSFSELEVGENIYRLSDGKMMIVRPRIVRVDKSSLFTESGDPLYNIETQTQVLISKMPSDAGE